MTNKYNTVLYTGVTSDIEKRAWQHKNGIKSVFTSKYNCNKLVYIEEYQWIQDAIAREKQIKSGPRRRKIELIKIQNPEWKDLSEGW